MKRALDICLALCLLPLAIPVVLAAAVFVVLDSSGSPIFLQSRVGRHKKIFMLLKLRTMLKDTGDLGSHEVSAVRLTRVGRILRKTKIDELPQIMNVLTGDMSFVGPRPCLPVQTELIAHRDRLGVFEVRPGITGIAQITGIDMSTPAELARKDAEYIAGRSLVGDLLIIACTATGSGRGDAARGS